MMRLKTIKPQWMQNTGIISEEQLRYWTGSEREKYINLSRNSTISFMKVLTKKLSICSNRSSKNKKSLMPSARKLKFQPTRFVWGLAKLVLGSRRPILWTRWVFSEKSSRKRDQQSWIPNKFPTSACSTHRPTLNDLSTYSSRTMTPIYSTWFMRHSPTTARRSINNSNQISRS